MFVPGLLAQSWQQTSAGWLDYASTFCINTLHSKTKYSHQYINAVHICIIQVILSIKVYYCVSTYCINIQYAALFAFASLYINIVLQYNHNICNIYGLTMHPHFASIHSTLQTQNIYINTSL